MKRLLPLLMLTLVGISCSKDDDDQPQTVTLNGVVLHNTTKAPIAGADISVYFPRFSNPLGYVTYTATTNAQGQFTLSIIDSSIGNRYVRRQYNVQARKAGTVQTINSSYPRFMTRSLIYTDTTFLDDAAYVSMKLKVAPMSGAESSQFFVWEPISPYDYRQDIEVSYETDKRVILGNLPAGTIVKALDSFAYADYTKILVEQFTGTTSKKTIVKKIIPLLPRDTTFIDLQ